LTQDALRADHATRRQYDPALLEFLSGVTMLVIDCQYTDAEYETKRGWGHNSVATVVDLCVQVRPDTVILFHHDPERTDAQVAAMAGDVSARLERAGVLETLVLPARERLAMQVRKPIRPLPLPHWRGKRKARSLPPNLPACQLRGVVGRLPPTTQVIDFKQLASLKLGQSASLPLGIGPSPQRLRSAHQRAVFKSTEDGGRLSCRSLN